MYFALGHLNGTGTRHRMVCVGDAKRAKVFMCQEFFMRATDLWFGSENV